MAVEQLIETLRQHFPGSGATTVADYVYEIYRRYDGAPIRDFVPLLVEREVRRGLTAITDGGGPHVPAQR
ncbi:hypothetical protein EDD30_1490 [Couchioplanes caeruleus]|uniref:Uncharacterized protein n=3 Tax=Couchioplanes caeruleus TaxID=56438 RepID=A0A1K0FAU2_9ACTN|nr:hypothetical protein BG844_34775 [Couchioplanes caeruleus subsp. caeruleus]ROP28718.1 hypothetical protein EDD30_1490 [Couchioplanes caeruleus]